MRVPLFLGSDEFEKKNEKMNNAVTNFGVCVFALHLHVK